MMQLPPMNRTSRVIEARLCEASTTLARMPQRELGQLRHLRALWPDTAQEAFDLWIGYDRTRVRVRLTPTAPQISRTDEMLALLALLGAGRPEALPPDIVQLVFFRAAGRPWRRLAAIRKAHYAHVSPAAPRPPGGVSHVSLRRLYRHGLLCLENLVIAAGVDLTLPDGWVEEEMRIIR